MCSVRAPVPAARPPEVPQPLEKSRLLAEPPPGLRQHQLQLPQVWDPAGAGAGVDVTCDIITHVSPFQVSCHSVTTTQEGATQMVAHVKSGW